MSREKRVGASGKAGKNPKLLGNVSLYVIWTHRIPRDNRHLLSHPIRPSQCLHCAYTSNALGKSQG